MKKKKILHKVLSVAMIACLLAGSASIGTANWATSTGGAGLSVSAAANITLNKNTLTLGKGESYSLKVTSGNKSVSWKSSNSKILKVNNSGKVTAVSTGTAWINAIAPNGEKKSCKVTVKNAPNKVSLSKTNITLGVGETYSLNAVIDSNAGSATRTFYSSNNSVVKMTNTNWTGKFKAVKPGVAWVNVKLYNGKHTSCKVTVKPAPTSVKLSKSSMTLKVGQKASLDAIIDSKFGCASRTFYSSNNAVVKMIKTNWKGEFKAVKEGVAWVNVKLYNGKNASCKITVKPDNRELNKWVRQKYKYFLNQTSIPWYDNRYYDASDFQFKIFDLNDDGIDELLLYCDGACRATGKVCVLSYNDEIDEFEMLFRTTDLVKSYYPKSGIITYCTAHEGVLWTTYGVYRNHIFYNILGVTDTTRVYSGTKGITYYDYSQDNSKKISKAQFDKILKSYLVKGDKEVSLVKYSNQYIYGFIPNYLDNTAYNRSKI